MSAETFSQLNAVDRAAALCDPGTLALSGGEGAARTSVVAAGGRIDGREVVLVLTDGHRRGGTIGLAEAPHFTQALGVAERHRAALVVCWDTGGVRVQEGSPALAATSAVGVALARAALHGIHAITLISGPRGCFGAPAVVAALGHGLLMTRDSLWGLTGPQLVDGAPEAIARVAMSAEARQAQGLAATIGDAPAEIRRELARRLAQPLRRIGPQRVLDECVATAAALLDQLPRPTAPPDLPRPHRRGRDFFAYSFRHQWQPTGPIVRRGHVHAAWGELAGAPAMGIIVGPERPHEGIGVADAHTVVEAVRFAAASSRGAPAPIVMFLFCRGHATAIDEERAGLPRALAVCLKALVTARLLGHPLVSVLGGGAYGAAYLTFAAPSHRVLAIRGTAVAPMAPRVLSAFRRLRGLRDAPQTPPDLARMIPEIRIVESVVRLPRALAEELAVARRAAAATPPARRLTAAPATTGSDRGTVS